MADDKIPTTQYGAFATPSPQYSPPATVTAATGRPGYDYDPYDTPGERAEGMFIGKWIGKITGNPDGFCSTHREWHILLAGISAGLKAGTLSQVPDCPPLWMDEMQYFNDPAMIANVVKCQWPGVVTVIGGLIAANAAGIPLPFVS
jgi:hypothetical protein